MVAGLNDATCELSWRRAGRSFPAGLAFFCHSLFTFVKVVFFEMEHVFSSWPAPVSGDQKGLRTVEVEGEAGFSSPLELPSR